MSFSSMYATSASCHALSGSPSLAWPPHSPKHMAGPTLQVKGSGFGEEGQGFRRGVGGFGGWGLELGVELYPEFGVEARVAWGVGNWVEGV